MYMCVWEGRERNAIIDNTAFVFYLTVTFYTTLVKLL